MNNCPNCGSNISPDMNNCPSCGTNLKTNEGEIVNNVENKVIENNISTGFKPVERNIAVCIILSLITCGIYSLYWFYCLTEDTNKLCKENVTASGGLAILYSLLSCGIYTYYWSYKSGKKIEEATGEDDSVLYLILTVLCLGIITQAIMQDKLNKLAK